MEEEKKLPANKVTSEDILNKINNISTNEELKEVTSLFNLNMTKKEMARVLQQDELLDLVLKQAGDRLRKRPDELSTKDLIDYMNVFQNNVNKTQAIVDKVESQPMIQINDNKKVVVSVGGLDRDSSNNVIDAIKDILKDLNSSQDDSLQTLLDSVKTVDNSNESEDK